MWSYVGNKENQRWLWHAIDHHRGEVLAYGFGSHEDAMFLELKKLLAPFGITTFYPDDWGAYERHLPATQRVVGKANTQKIERKHLTLRTRIKRLVRRTICFSKLDKMHDIVIGLFINRAFCKNMPEAYCDRYILCIRPQMKYILCNFAKGSIDMNSEFWCKNHLWNTTAMSSPRSSAAS